MVLLLYHEWGRQTKLQIIALFAVLKLRLIRHVQGVKTTNPTKKCNVFLMLIGPWMFRIVGFLHLPPHQNWSTWLQSWITVGPCWTSFMWEKAHVISAVPNDTRYKAPAVPPRGSWPRSWMRPCWFMGFAESMIRHWLSLEDVRLDWGIYRECVFFKIFIFGCPKQIQDDFRGLYHPILSGIITIQYYMGIP